MTAENNSTLIQKAGAGISKPMNIYSSRSLRSLMPIVISRPVVS
ncbi:MAG: hypothetical protein ACI9LO_001859 [Planctomycetota bacterium]|jgi:hypothetical protein